MPNTDPLSPLLRSVDIQQIQDWVPEAARRRIDLSKAWGIIRDHFCAALVTRGVCPAQCERCREELVDLFRLDSAGSPAALLTWLAKDHSARMIERLITAQKEAEFQARESQDTTPQALYASLFPKRDTDLIEELRKSYEQV